MHFNLCSVTVAALVVSVAALPGPEGLNHVGDGAVGKVFRREGSGYQHARRTGSGSSPTGSGASPSATGGTIASGGSIPAASGTSVLSAAQTIAAGESFDGGMTMFDRGASCSGQAEGDDSDAVFIIEAGGSLSNVIIGPNQIEGVHCNGGCTLTNVWWSAVCEDAFTIKLQDAGETTTITGGGAFGADDKVLQHNGAGTMSVSGFTVEDFGKMYRACGNCKSSYERHVVISDATATNGDLIAGINSNFGDTAKISGLKATGVEEICERFEGVESGSEPTSIGVGNDGVHCIIS
ncbi:unnamed protein product [Discula destructiva]